MKKEKNATDGVADKQRNIFLMFLEAGHPRSRWQHDGVLVKALQVADCGLLTVSSGGGRCYGALWGPFYKGTSPIHAGSSS